MAAAAFDVWFLKADTVYRAVPYGVVTGWAEQGRLAADDKLRPAGVQSGWVRAADHPLISDFLSTGTPRAAAAPPADAAGQLQPVEMDAGWRRRPEDEDDDVDMIPLIDISLVLLIFFMMTATVATFSPVDVPGMKHASQVGKDVEALTVQIDKRANGEVFYALRVGDQPPAPDDNNLATKDEVVARLKARLGAVTGERKPEVRVACHKELPRLRVREVATDLHALKGKNLIAYYGAEVNEAK